MHRALPAMVLTAGLAAATVAGCSGPGGPPVAGVTPAATAPAGHAKPPQAYYLSLGDSLSQGVQPGPSGASIETRQGYADQLYALLRPANPGLRLVKLGCPGETTATMVNGGICRYPGGSQLAAAVRFLRAHRGQVALVTIDIGANDPDACLTQPSVGKLATCVGKAIPAATANLAKILTRLRQADPHGRMLAMSYYLPALAQWRNGLAGQLVARGAAAAAQVYNNLLSRVYRTFGVRVADVFGAFHTADFSGRVPVPGYGTLPVNVAAICRWTWECASPPRGPNQHANQAGYRVIARAFLLADPGLRATATPPAR